MTCNVYSASAPAGAAANGAGDSGGPVFRFSGSQMYGVGIVSQGAGVVGCPAGSVAGTCYNTLYYEDLQAALNDWALTLNT